MFESNEFLCTAAETGYRICALSSVIPDSSYRIFQVCWEKSDVPKCYVFTQDGCIKIIDFQQNCKTTGYEVLFHRFSSHGSIKEENVKRINLHFDKVVLLPNNPGEILFVLGISNILYYSAIPGSSSRLTRPGQLFHSGFISGTSVLQLLSHKSRITVVALSNCGSILATGDDNGNFKLMILSLTENEKTLNNESTNLVLSHRGHNNSIYSMKWLTINDYQDVYGEIGDGTYGHKCYHNWYLITGSSDRQVKIWRVSWKPSQDSSKKCLFQVTQIIVFDTMSATILDISLTNTPHHAFLTDSLSHKFGYQDTSIIVGSTNIGTIYVWKISHTDIISMPDTHCDVDSGYYLISMVHSSEYSIFCSHVNFVYNSKLQYSDSILIDATMTRKWNTLEIENYRDIARFFHSHSLILIAVDTSGVVRSHVLKDCASFLQGKPDESVITKTHLNKTPNPSMIDNFTFALLGEVRYSHPVVSCSFQRSELFQQFDTNRSSSVGVNVAYRNTTPTLVLFLVSGESIFFPISDILLNNERNDVNESVDESSNLTTSLNKSPNSASKGITSQGGDGDIKRFMIDNPRNSPVVLQDPKKKMDATDNGSVDEDINPRDVADVLPSPLPSAKSTVPATIAIVSKKSSDEMRRLSAGMQSTKKSVRVKSPARSGGSSNRSHPAGENVAVVKEKLSVENEISRFQSKVNAHPQSELSSPTFNSSLVYQHALKKFASDQELENVSVASVETSSSDRRQSANKTVNMNLNDRRYSSLVNPTEEEINQRLPKKVNIKAQVDQAWRKRKEELSPSQEDLNLLVPSDPLVAILVADGDTVRQRIDDSSSQASSQHTSNSGLQFQYASGKQLLPSFHMSISANNIFGEISPNQQYQSAAWKMERDNILWKSVLYDNKLL